MANKLNDDEVDPELLQLLLEFQTGIAHVSAEQAVRQQSRDAIIHELKLKHPALAQTSRRR